MNTKYQETTRGRYVSRGTVQRLLAAARARVARALVNNKALCIR